MTGTIATARRAEAGGFDSIWVADHLFIPPGNPMPEAWTTMSAIAGATTRVGVGALVLCQSFRNPGLLAKMATTLDLLSNGRFRFLVGAGWNEAEYTAFGYDFPPAGVRVSQLEETVQICRGMWTAGNEAFTYEGRHHRVRDVVNVPPPTRTIPIGIGAVGDRMLDLVAREADEWNWPGITVPAWDERNAYLEERLAVHERTVRKSVQSVFAPGDDDPQGALPFFNPELALYGSTNQMIDQVCKLRDIGIDGFYAPFRGDRELDTAIDVLPALRAALSG